VLGRAQLVRLGSEAELAAVLAHEIAHLESGLPALDRKVSIDDATMRVLEGAADERATLLLARAGYPPGALARALGVLEDDPMDRRHPRRDVRQRRLSLLADPRASGDDGRARFLAAIAGVPAGGRDEHRVGAAYVFARAGLAVEPPAGVRGDGWSLEGGLGAGALRYWTYALGARAGEELAARLRDRHALRVAAGEVLVGRTPAELQGVLSSRDQLLERLRREQWSLPAHAAIAVFARRGEAVLLVVDGADAVSAVEAWARRVRAPTAAERAAAEPARIVLVPAPRAGTVGELVAACVDPAAARELDAPSRVLAAGELMKCTDRVIAGDAAAK
jgi:predicted Zn-dependent protease